MLFEGEGTRMPLATSTKVLESLNLKGGRGAGLAT